eukprot:764484-Hanusia_phi.AAC.1
MWGPVNGLTLPRSARVRDSFRLAMQQLGVPTLESFALSAPRADQTHDGLHYFGERGGEGGAGRKEEERRTTSRGERKGERKGTRSEHGGQQSARETRSSGRG